MAYDENCYDHLAGNVYKALRCRVCQMLDLQNIKTIGQKLKFDAVSPSHSAARSFYWRDFEINRLRVLDLR